MIYVLLAFMVIITLVLKSPKIKGLIGEQSVALRLRKLPPDQYAVLHDVTIPNDRAKTSQIDHIIVSVYGIFVIETKNYQGWIMGDERSEYWTQVIYKRKEKLYNPIRQNYGHTMALKSLLANYGDLPIIPIVSFSNRATLKVTTSSEVIYSTQLIRTINKYTNSTIQQSKLTQITATIMQANITDKAVKKQHVKAIKQTAADKTNKVSNDICPKCGASLVARHGKFGPFKGCSNYPKCRFIHK